jgi:hypothetical protein
MYAVDQHAYRDFFTGIIIPVSKSLWTVSFINIRPFVFETEIQRGGCWLSREL